MFKAMVGLPLFLADVPIMPPLENPSSWASIFIQGGAFILVCYIVAFLYPKQMKEARDEREKRDGMFMEIFDKMQTKFEIRNQAVVSAIERQTDSIIAEYHAAADKITVAVKNGAKT